MIELEILSSRDEEIIGPFLTMRNEISLGKSLKNDLVIDDSEISSVHLRIKIEGNVLKLFPEEKMNFHHNGKKNLSAKILKAQDEIQIGKTKFKIKNFFNSPKEAHAEKSLQEIYEKVCEEDSIKKKILDELQNELLYLDYQSRI